MSTDDKQALVDALGDLAWALDAQGRKADSRTCTSAAIWIAGSPEVKCASLLRGIPEAMEAAGAGAGICLANAEQLTYWRDQVRAALRECESEQS